MFKLFFKSKNVKNRYNRYKSYLEYKNKVDLIFNESLTTDDESRLHHLLLKYPLVKSVTHTKIGIFDRSLKVVLINGFSFKAYKFRSEVKCVFKQMHELLSKILLESKYRRD